MDGWKRASLHPLLLAIGAFALAACEGPAGPQGDQGPAGPAGEEGQDGQDGSDGQDGQDGQDGSDGVAPGPLTSLHVEVFDIDIGTDVTLELHITDQDGLAFNGVAANQLRFTLAKLIPGEDGDPDAWQSYINRLEVPPSDVGPGGSAVLESAVQATAEVATAGVLEALGGGVYVYTFDLDIHGVTDPLAVSYEPDLTHRVAVQLSGGGLPATNATYDFVPAGGPVVHTRNVISNASCNECHQQLTFHGARQDVNYCVTCHNPGSTDANSGHSLDFAVMIHKIHRGQDLPSVQAGGEYALWGFGNRKHDYSDLSYPQDIRNCAKCHDGSVTEDGDHWQHNPNLAACGSCHDDVSFETPVPDGMVLHTAGAMADNSGCANCHEPGKFASTVTKHARPSIELAREVSYEIVAIEDTSPGEFPSVTYRITHDGAPVVNGEGGWVVSTGVIIGWDNTDFRHSVHGTMPGRAIGPISHNTATTNADGSYTVTSPTAIPMDAMGSGTVAVQGRLQNETLTGLSGTAARVPVQSVSAPFAITDASAIARRQVVDINKCLSCHEVLSFHGANRTDDINTCATCHNPSNTDIGRRTGGTMEDGFSVIDGLAEAPIDMKTMIHAIHAGNVTLYGFSGPHDFSDVRYPGNLANCNACHVDGSHQLPLAAGIIGTTIDTDPDGSGNRADLYHHTRMSPSAAACSTCHDTALARAHITHNGGLFDTSLDELESGAVVETCVLCHGPGKTADVDAVHGL